MDRKSPTAVTRNLAGSSPDATERLSRRELNRLRTRHAILSAARRSFARTPISVTTMDEIAETAGVSRQTAFNYFASKAEIVAALLAEQADGFVTLIRRESDSDHLSADRIRRVFGQSAQALQDAATLSRRLLDPSEQGWSASTGGKAPIGTVVEAFTLLIETAPDAAELRDDVPAHQLGELLLSAYTGIINLWRVRDDYPLIPRLEQAARLMSEMMRRR